MRSRASSPKGCARRRRSAGASSAWSAPIASWTCSRGTTSRQPGSSPVTPSRPIPRCRLRIAVAGHEIGHHGWTHMTPVTMSRDEEEAGLQRGTDAIVKLCGLKPRGYRSPAWDLSENTVDLLVSPRLPLREQHDGERLHPLLRAHGRRDRARGAHAARDRDQPDRDADQLDAGRLPALRIRAERALQHAGPDAGGLACCRTGWTTSTT